MLALRLAASYAVIGAAILAARAAAAPLTLESAQMGSTNQIAGQVVSSSQWMGWRFELESPLALTEVGAHLRGISGDIFAAIVKLDSLTAFPKGAPLTEAETVATKKFTPPIPSDEFLVPLTARLNAGAYALVFGSGQFDATGTALIPNFNQPNIAPTVASSYISWRQEAGSSPWSNGGLSNLRFVIYGVEFVGPTDFNRDGAVDRLDLARWGHGLSNFNIGVADLGDADDDLDSDGADFLAWQRTFGSTLPAPTTALAVPEMPALALAVAAAAATASIRVSRSARRRRAEPCASGSTRSRQ